MGGGGGGGVRGVGGYRYGEEHEGVYICKISYEIKVRES